jgi:hypothetical protein
MQLVRSRGHESALFSMAHEKGDQHPYQHHFVPHIDFKKSGIWNSARASLHAIYSWKSRNYLREMIREFKPDIAHVRNIYHHLSPSILWELKAQKIPVIYHLNDFKLLCPSYNMVSHGMHVSAVAADNFGTSSAKGVIQDAVVAAWFLRRKPTPTNGYALTKSA